MSSKSKRQQTMAKRTREQTVREKRAMKVEKKAAAAAARAAGIDPTLQVDTGSGELEADHLLVATEPAEEPASV